MSDKKVISMCGVDNGVQGVLLKDRQLGMFPWELPQCVLSGSHLVHLQFVATG